MTSDAQLMDLTPEVVTQKWYRGATPPFAVVADYENGDPVVLTGARAEMELKDLNGNLLKTYSSDSGQGIVFTDAANGAMLISPEAKDTSDLPVDQVLRYDLLVRLADDSVWPFYRGIIVVKEQTTEL